jgi:hypothetical protein
MAGGATTRWCAFGVDRGAKHGQGVGFSHRLSVNAGILCAEIMALLLRIAPSKSNRAQQCVHMLWCNSMPMGTLRTTHRTPGVGFCMHCYTHSTSHLEYSPSSYSQVPCGNCRLTHQSTRLPMEINTPQSAGTRTVRQAPVALQRPRLPTRVRCGLAVG